MRVKLILLLSVIIISCTFGKDMHVADSVKIITDAKYIDDSTILVIDTLKKTDTMFVYFGNDNKIFFEISLSVDPAIGLSPYFSNNNDYNVIVNQQNDEISYIASYRICSNVKFCYNNFLFGTGIQYLNYRESVAHLPNNFLIDVFPYQKLDTISTWGQVINGDTSYINETEWNTYYTYDTTYIKNKYSNTFCFVEIPIKIGKKININQFCIDITFGIINQFFINTKKDILQLNSARNLYPIDKSNFRKYNLSYNFNINLNQELANNIYLTYGINYNKCAFSIFHKNHDYSKKISLVGLQLGVIFRL